MELVQNLLRKSRFLNNCDQKWTKYKKMDILEKFPENSQFSKFLRKSFFQNSQKFSFHYIYHDLFCWWYIDLFHDGEVPHSRKYRTSAGMVVTKFVLFIYLYIWYNDMIAPVLWNNPEWYGQIVHMNPPKTDHVINEIWHKKKA